MKDYSHIILTEEETKEAIYEAKKKKFFLEKHGYYWEQREKDKKPLTIISRGIK